MRCPSQDWDDYYAANEPPDACPTCGGPNFDEEKDDWSCAEALGFCSVECKEKWDDEEAFQFAVASCVRHRDLFYASEGCLSCDQESFEEYAEGFAREGPSIASRDHWRGED